MDCVSRIAGALGRKPVPLERVPWNAWLDALSQCGAVSIVALYDKAFRWANQHGAWVEMAVERQCSVQERVGAVLVDGYLQMQTDDWRLTVAPLPEELLVRPEALGAAAALHIEGRGYRVGVPGAAVFDPQGLDSAVVFVPESAHPEVSEAVGSDVQWIDREWITTHSALEAQFLSDEKLDLRRLETARTRALEGLPPRLARICAAVFAAGSYSLVQRGGQTLVRVVTKGARTMSAVSDAELEQVRQVTGIAPAGTGATG